jgi:uracil-DNA glycosylase
MPDKRVAWMSKITISSDLSADKTRQALPNPSHPLIAKLEALSCQVDSCQQCELSKTRIQTVFFDGNPLAKVMLVGEGPGQQEDETGVPFVGRAGQLLTKILASVGINRQRDIYICNTVKCRPPQNRKPLSEEMAACFPFLESQIRLVQPKLILLAGATAVQSLLKTSLGITKIRGQWFDLPQYQAKAMPIFHPSYLLRNPSGKEGSPKWLMWQDIQAIRTTMDKMGIPVSGVQE